MQNWAIVTILYHIFSVYHKHRRFEENTITFFV